MVNKYFITPINIVGMLKLAKEENAILFDYRIPMDKCGSRIESPLQMHGLPISVYTCDLRGISCTGEG